MAIQKIQSEGTSTSSNAVKRGIAKSAEGLMMEIVQKTQYTTPVPSMVRELASNAIDSQNEKVRAIDIISGKSKVSDFFIDREGDQYEDSKWDPSYFNLDRLDRENNHVEIRYIKKVSTGLTRSDRIVIKDYGVGIGGPRLKVLTDVGVSTKRNRKDALGAFGIGAKSPISTGADSYKTTSVHNGIKVSVKIYEDRLVSAIPSKDLVAGKDNLKIDLPGGGHIFGQKTNDLNYTEIETPCFRSQFNEYVQAVEEQLLFFKNIKLIVVEEDGQERSIDFNAETEYENEVMILTSKSPFTRPYIVIENGESKISYGLIDFKQLELEQMYGSIGLKCKIRQAYRDEDGNEVVVQEGLDVTPSRETVIWNAKTRKYVLDLFKKGQDNARDYVMEKMGNPDNLLDFLNTRKKVLSNSSDSTLGSLSKIIDKHSIEFVYKKVPIKNDILACLGTKLISVERGSYVNDGKFKIQREVRSFFDLNFDTDTIVRLEESSHSPMKDSYIGYSHLENPESRYRNDVTQFFNANKAIWNSNDVNFKPFWSIKIDQEKVADLSKKKDNDPSIRAHVHFLYNELKSSMIDYDNLDVPDDFKEVSDDVSEFVKDNKSESQMTHAEKRKISGEVSVSDLVVRYLPEYYGRHNSISGSSIDYYKSRSLDIKLEEIDVEKTWYFTKEEKTMGHLAQMIISHTFDLNLKEGRGASDRLYKVYLVSKTLAKKMNKAGLSHVSEFFGEYSEENKKMSFNEIVVKWFNMMLAKNMYKEHTSIVAFGKQSFFNVMLDLDSDYADEESKYVYINEKLHEESHVVLLSRDEEKFGVSKEYKEYFEFLKAFHNASLGNKEDLDKQENVKDLEFSDFQSIMDEEWLQKCDKFAKFSEEFKTIMKAISEGFPGYGYIWKDESNQKGQIAKKVKEQLKLLINTQLGKTIYK